MKGLKIIYRILILLTTVITVSCQKESKTYDFVGPRDREVFDGGFISGIYVQCFEKNYSTSNYEEYAKTHYLNNYADVNLTVDVDYPACHEYLNEYPYDFCREFFNFMREKSSFILDDLNRYRKETNNKLINGWPYIFTAYINGEVSITCDKTLFGKAPGTNLSNHFKVLIYKNCIANGIDEPRLRYRYGEIESPLNMPEYFAKGDWLMREYNLLFEDIPTEKYEKLIFKIKMPVLCENTVNRLKNQKAGNVLLNVYEEKEFETEFYLLFDWD